MQQSTCKRNVVLLSTHIVNDFIIRKYRDLYNDLNGNGYDVILLYNMEDENKRAIPPILRL